MFPTHQTAFLSFLDRDYLRQRSQPMHAKRSSTIQELGLALFFVLAFSALFVGAWCITTGFVMAGWLMGSYLFGWSEPTLFYSGLIGAVWMLGLMVALRMFHEGVNH